MRGWEAEDTGEYEILINEAVDKKLNGWRQKELPVLLEEKCRDIEKILTEVGMKCQRANCADKHDMGDEPGGTSTLQELIARRKMARAAGQKDVARDVCKKIQKEVRAVARARKRGKIGRI